MIGHALIIGDGSDRLSKLVRQLQSLGYQSHFAACFEDACHQIAEQPFDLVFSPIRKQPGTISSLMSVLTGSQTSLFCSYAVHDGCWWVPVIRRGEPCLGSPAFPPGEFAAVLAEVAREIGCREDQDKQRCHQEGR